MEIKINSLLPFDKIINEAANVFELVDKNGKVVLLKNNQPAYIIIKYDEDKIAQQLEVREQKNLTLQEAMKLVLLEAKDNTMHASDLAEEIFTRRLYLQKNGNKAQYNQIRARCGHYPNMFEALPGNYIKLKVGVE